MSSGRAVVVAVPGLSGGVDEAARHLFGSPEMHGRWQVRVLTTKGQRSLLAPLVLVAAVGRLVAWRLTGRVDLLHLNMSSRGSTARKMVLGTVARAIGLPYVIQLHGGGFDDFHHGLPSVGRRAIAWFFAGARQVFVLGAPFGRLVEETIGVGPDRVSVLRNAVELPPLASRPADPTPMILFTGRLGPGKGIPELLEALAALADPARADPALTDAGWRAVLAGDGDITGVTARVAELGLVDRVDVRPWQSRDQVADLLGQASIFVLPSHLEALSVALLEAMAEGLCCVATPVGAQAEIVEHDVNGLLVEPGDVDGLVGALTRALTDGELRRRLGDGARATITSTCSTGVVADQLSTTYERVLIES